MDTRLMLLGSTGVGAGMMYLLDPATGNRRRAVLRDTLVRTVHKVGDAVGPTARDLYNRACGVLAETAALVRSEAVPEEVLAERVRAELGRVVSHPSSVAVTATQGRVTLSGPVLVSEEKALPRSVAAVRGVRAVESHLEVHRQADGVPGLQGGRKREPRFALLQTNWSPTARLCTGVAGGMLAVYGANRRDVAGLLLSGMGLSLLARGSPTSSSGACWGSLVTGGQWMCRKR